MENQVNISDQNPQQIGQNPVNQPLQIIEKPRAHYLGIGLVILVCFVLLGYGGYYIGKQASKPLQNLEQNQNQTTPSSITARESDLMANWKIYTNTKYGFLLKYPNEYVVSNEDPGGKSVYFVPNNYESLPEQDKYNAPTINLNIVPSSTANGQNTPEIFVDSAKAPGFGNKRDIVAKTVAGQPAMQFMSNNTQAGSGRDEINTVIQILTSNTLVLITVATEDNRDTYNLSDQILTTFELLNQKISDSSWQSYTNPAALYEVQYPIGWRVVPYNIGEGYGPKEIGEDVLWAINFYEKKDYTLDTVAAEFGKQFSDRKQTKEDVMLNNIPAVKFTTTTASIPDWYLVNIVVERGTSYIVMSNGAITNENLQKMRGVATGTTFDRFYKSFHFVN